MQARPDFRKYLKIISVIVGILLSGPIPAQQQKLEYFLNSGMQNSPLLKDYNNRIKSALIDSMRIRAGQGIQVNGTSNNYYAPVVKGWGYDEIKTDIAELSAVIQVSKEITSGKKLQNRYQALRLQNQSTLLEGSLTAKDLKKSIISQYILAYGDQKLYELNLEVLDALRQEEIIVKKLAEKGSYKQTEYLSFVVNISQQELVTEKSLSLLKTDYETLNYICGIYDTTRYVLTVPDLVISKSSDSGSSVFVKQFVLDSLRLKNDDRQVDLEYQPKLSLFADGGYMSSLALTPWKNFGLSAGLNLSVPIYDGRQKQMQHDQISISESTRLNYRNYFVNQYRQQIALLEHRLSSAEQIAGKIVEQQKYARALVDANRMLLQTGDIPVTDYILSVNNYMTANNMLIENTIERYSIINELNYWSEK